MLSGYGQKKAACVGTDQQVVSRHAQRLRKGGEMLTARTSERQGRLIDKDEAGSMEKKKREGYF